MKIATKVLALDACYALVAAYKRGLENSGEIDWEDIDAAHRIAAAAVDQDKKDQLHKVVKKREDARK